MQILATQITCLKVAIETHHIFPLGNMPGLLDRGYPKLGLIQPPMEHIPYAVLKHP